MSDAKAKDSIEMELVHRLEPGSLLHRETVCKLAGSPSINLDLPSGLLHHGEPMTEWAALKLDSLASDGHLAKHGYLTERPAVEPKTWLTFLETFKAAFHKIREETHSDPNEAKSRLMEEALMEAAKKRGQKPETSVQTVLAMSFAMVVESLDSLKSSTDRSKVEQVIAKVEKLCQTLTQVDFDLKSLSSELSEVSTRFAGKLVETAIALRDREKKETIRKLVSSAVMVSRLSGKLSAILSLITKLVEHDLYATEYLPDISFFKKLTGGNHIIFASKPSRRVAFQHPHGYEHQSDKLSTDCHIICDPTRVLLEDGNNKIMLEKTLVLTSPKIDQQAILTMPLQYSFSHGYRSEAFTKLGGIWVSESSEIGPLSCQYSGYNRNFYYSHQNTGSSMSSAAIPLMKNFSGDYRSDMHGYSGNDEGEFFATKIYKNKHQDDKFITSVQRYDKTNSKYGYARVKSEVPLTLDGALFHKGIENIKTANCHFMGRTLLMNIKSKKVLVANGDSGEIHYYGETPMVINGFDSHALEVVTLEADDTLAFTPFDLFSRYDALPDDSTDASPDKPKIKVEEFGLLPNDESFEEADEDEPEKASGPVLEMKEEKSPEQETPAAIKPPADQTPAIKWVEEKAAEGMAYFMRNICFQSFNSKLFEQEEHLSGAFKEQDFFLVPNSIDLVPATFSELISICQFASRAEKTKFGSCLALYSLHLVHTHLSRTMAIQSSSKEGPKILLQSTALKLMQAVKKLSFKKELQTDLQWRCFNKIKCESQLMIACLLRTPLVDSQALDELFEAAINSVGIIDQKLLTIYFSNVTISQKPSRSAAEQTALMDSLMTKIIQKLSKVGELERQLIDDYYCCYPKNCPELLDSKTLILNLRAATQFLTRHWSEFSGEQQGKLLEASQQQVSKMADCLKKLGDGFKNNGSWGEQLGKELKTHLRNCTSVALFLVVFDLAFQSGGESPEQATCTALCKDWICKLSDFRNDMSMPERKAEELTFEFERSNGPQVKFSKIENPLGKAVRFTFDDCIGCAVLELFGKPIAGTQVQSLGLLIQEKEYSGFQEFFVAVRVDLALKEKSSVVLKWTPEEFVFDLMLELTDYLIDVSGCFLLSQGRRKLEAVNLLATDLARVRMLGQTGLVFSEEAVRYILSGESEWTSTTFANQTVLTDAESKLCEKLLPADCGSAHDKAARLLLAVFLRLEGATEDLINQDSPSLATDVQTRITRILSKVHLESSESAQSWKQLAFLAAIQKTSFKQDAWSAIDWFVEQYKAVDLEHLFRQLFAHYDNFKFALDSVENLLNLVKLFPSMAKAGLQELMHRDAICSAYLTHLPGILDGPSANSLAQSTKKIVEILSSFVGLKRNDNDDNWENYTVFNKTMVLEMLGAFLSVADPALCGLDLAKIFCPTNEKDSDNSDQNLKRCIAKFCGLALTNMDYSARAGHSLVSEAISLAGVFILSHNKSDEPRFLEELEGDQCMNSLPKATKSIFGPIDYSNFRKAALQKIEQNQHLTPRSFKSLTLAEEESVVDCGCSLELKDQANSMWGFHSAINSPTSQVVPFVLRNILRITCLAQSSVLSALSKKKAFLDALANAATKNWPLSLKQTILRIIGKVWATMDESTEKEKAAKEEIKSRILAANAHREDIIIPAEFSASDHMDKLDSIYFKDNLKAYKGLTIDETREVAGKLVKKQLRQSRQGNESKPNEKHSKLREKIYLHINRPAERTGDTSKATSALELPHKDKSNQLDPRVFSDLLTLNDIFPCDIDEKQSETQNVETSSKPQLVASKGQPKPLTEEEIVARGVIMDSLLDFSKKVPADLRQLITLNHGQPSPLVKLDNISRWVAITDKGQQVLQVPKDGTQTFLTALRVEETQMIGPSLVRYCHFASTSFSSSSDGIQNKQFIKLDLSSTSQELNFENGKSMTVLLVPCIPALSSAEIDMIRQPLRNVVDRRAAAMTSLLPELRKLVANPTSTAKLDQWSKEALSRYLLLEWNSLWEASSASINKESNLLDSPSARITKFIDLASIETDIKKEGTLAEAYNLASRHGEKCVGGQVIVSNDLKGSTVSSEDFRKNYSQAALHALNQLVEEEVVVSKMSENGLEELIFTQGEVNSRQKDTSYRFGLSIGLAALLGLQMPFKLDFNRFANNGKSLEQKSVAYMVLLGVSDMLGQKTNESALFGRIAEVFGNESYDYQRYSIQLTRNHSLKAWTSSLEEKPASSKADALAPAASANKTSTPAAKVEQKTAKVEEDQDELSLGGLFD